MWNCVNCGERNTRPDECASCGRPRRSLLPWEAPPRAQIWEPEPPKPLWIPEQADPQPPEEPIRSRVLPALPIVVLVAALITAVVLGGPRLLGDEPQATTRPAAVATLDPAPAEPLPILEEHETRLVTVDPAVTDPRAGAVADMFETFFTGINERDYQAVSGVLDPDGELDPGAPGQMAAFARGTATTRDSDVVLRDLTAVTARRLHALVTFRSSQRAGHGPPGRLDETCTEWRVRYLLTSGSGGYRIRQADAGTEPC
ncbi:MAG TPA: hypothetical protein VN408_30240 [Actinoplanes sp.]|nr:hypothetical protein [Actinoplanes sp.]